MTFTEKVMEITFYVICFITRILPLKNYIIFESKPDFSDNTFFLYQKMLEKKYNLKYKMFWILNGQKYEGALPKNVYTIRRAHGNAFEKIRFLWIKNRARFIIDCSAFIQKNSDKQHRIHLKHGLPLKSADQYNFLIGEVDLISVPSDYWITKCAEEHNVDASKIKPLGFPRNDVLKSCPHQNINIVWMPTWIYGDFNTDEEKNANPLVEKMPFGLPCIENYEQLDEINEIFKKNNAYLYIRLHPVQDSTALSLRENSNIIICNDNYLKSQNTTLYRFLCSTDALISDYSSVYYDYLRLDKPIALITENYKEYKEICGKLKYSYDEFTENFPANFVTSYEELLEFFNNIFEGKDPAEAKRKEAMMKYMPPTDSDSSENIINYLIENFDF